MSESLGVEEVISDARLTDCIEVAKQEVLRFAAAAHGRTRIKADTLRALEELADRRKRSE